MPRIDFEQATEQGGVKSRGRGENMIKDFRNKEDYFDYRYWKRYATDGGIDIPVRVVSRKNEIDADTIEPETGKLVSNRMFLINIRRDELVERIDEAEFNRLCEEHIAAYQKKTTKPEPGGMG